ncbi:uncharacterized protein LOC126623008 isoform X2 [Malus sylvestris]|nr:uncharacterized protein LOC126623008 isoform X2 [Malus sylvestris]
MINNMQVAQIRDRKGCKGRRSGSGTLTMKRNTSYNANLVPAKDDSLIPEQRERTGQLRHHRSTSHTKGRRIHDRSVGSKMDGQTAASIDKNSTSFQEPRSVNLGGKISYPCKLNCCRFGNNSCTQFCGVWICDLIVLPPCIAKLS